MSGLLAAAKAGRSQVLVLWGEAGIGKTALLDFVLERAVGCRVSRATGVESETDFAFAGLHQLCRPYLDRLEELPLPQRAALDTAFGLRPGSAPDRFLVGLAVLTLLSRVAAERPLVCLVDDAQWLDQASAQVVEFIARRLADERIALVLAARESADEPRFGGLPELVLRGLSRTDAAALLDSAVASTLDPRVRDRILAECHGNPLALIELPRGLSPAELAFGTHTDTGARPSVDRLERRLLRQLVPLPRESRQLLLTAAAEPVGDVPLLWRAAGRLGIAADAATATEAAGLLELRDRVSFRDPLVRSAVYRSATRAERREVHRALAEATDPDLAPDRRAWHRAHAAMGPDEGIAAELEHWADRAFSHGGLAAAAAFLERAAALTPDPAQRVRRSLEAAQAKVSAGAFEDAAALLAAAQLGPLGEAESALSELLLARLSSAARRGSGALSLLLAAARRLEELDPDLARDTYLDAFSAAVLAGRLAAGSGAREVAEAVRQAPPPRTPRKGDLLLQGLAVLSTDGYAPAAPLTRSAVQAFVSEGLAMDEALRFVWLAASAAASLWDEPGWDLLTRRHLDIARESGAVSSLPMALTSRVFVELFTGDLAAAGSLVQEIRTGGEAPTGRSAPYGEIGLLALRGDPQTAEPLLDECLDDARARGEGFGVNTVHWARAVLCNGLGRYHDALRAAREAAADPLELGPPKWALAELVEAAVRTGDARAAAPALEELSAMARASGTDWALGVEAGRRALLDEGRRAEDLYRESVDRLTGTRLRVELARVQLLYGEWLRREGRRIDARAQLRTAHESLTAMGVQAFAMRARHELMATGETARRRIADVALDLTAQEEHIARLAAQGLTNPQIGATLFISPKTVEWHLRKIFSKLGIVSRRELRRSLPDVDPNVS